MKKKNWWVGTWLLPSHLVGPKWFVVPCICFFGPTIKETHRNHTALLPLSPSCYWRQKWYMVNISLRPIKNRKLQWSTYSFLKNQDCSLTQQIVLVRKFLWSLYRKWEPCSAMYIIVCFWLVRRKTKLNGAAWFNG